MLDILTHIATMERKKDDKGPGPRSKYAIEVMDTAKSKIPQRPAAKEGIMPPFPFSMVISGPSGGGKSNLLMNIMGRDELYGRYFHYIIVFSPTAGSTDDTYKALKLPEENFVREMEPEMLTNLIAKRKELIEEKGIEWVAKHARMCLIMDDVIANRSFLQSEDALKMFALLRHYLCSIIILVQSYTKVPRALRMNANATIVFPAQRVEVEVLLDEITPPELSKREFEEVIKYATAQQYHFLYINRRAKPGQQIRHNLDDIIDLEKYKGHHHIRDSSAQDVTPNRRLVEEHRQPKREEGGRGQALQPRHPRDEEPAQQEAAVQPNHARSFLQGHARQ
jgi:hypothetical protein